MFLCFGLRDPSSLTKSGAPPRLPEVTPREDLGNYVSSISSTNSLGTFQCTWFVQNLGWKIQYYFLTSFRTIFSPFFSFKLTRKREKRTMICPRKYSRIWISAQNLHTFCNQVDFTKFQAFKIHIFHTFSRPYLSRLGTNPDCHFELQLTQIKVYV